MPDLRKDPIIARWVIIATERAQRPDNFKREQPHPSSKDAAKACPFCEGNESMTPPEVYAVRESTTSRNDPGWKVRVTQSIAPVLDKEAKLTRNAQGVYDMITGVGEHEVIIETPQHIANIADFEQEQIFSVIHTYCARISELEKDHRFKYVLLYKNYGKDAGAGIYQHSRSQLIALPVNPVRVKDKLAGARKYFEFKERCIFCDIIKQELASGERLVLETEKFVVLSPFAARAPFELWLLPKTHSPDFISMDYKQQKDLAETLKITLTKLKLLLQDPPYNYMLHTAPFRRETGPGYWKTIDYDYHWHIEIMPRLTKLAGFEWGTGCYIDTVTPEDAAKYMREVKLGKNNKHNHNHK